MRIVVKLDLPDSVAVDPVTISTREELDAFVEAIIAAGLIVWPDDDDENDEERPQ